MHKSQNKDRHKKRYNQEVHDENDQKKDKKYKIIQSKGSSSGNKRIQRVEHKHLLSHFIIPGSVTQMERQNEASPPTQSPSNQNLSYHQQQQIHQQQIQRTGGIQRLTADLVGLQFHDPEALFKNTSMPTTKLRNQRQAKSGLQSAIRPPQTSSKSTKTAKGEGQQVNSHGHEFIRHTDNAFAGGGYEEQMVYNAGSQGPDFDPVKDAQETAEDAAILRRFKIIHLVGTGNYARVYKGLSHNGKELAIKSINLSKTSENYKQKFLPRELTILRKLNHPNICKVHEIIQVADRVFILMQFCARGTIADLLHKHGPLSESIARNLFIQTVEAVAYMHSIDLAHRDLKVENILLNDEYCPKLTDFSYSIYTIDKQTFNKNATRTPGSFKQAPSRGSIRLNETFCGTLPYLSPEMIRQNPYDSKKTDIWSLGVCLYVMLNDRLPFPFNDIKLMVKKQLTKDYRFKANIEFSDQVKELVSQMLDPDYSKRLTCMDVGRHPWLNGPREKPSSC